jgi:hypothetical protein
MGRSSRLALTLALLLIALPALATEQIGDVEQVEGGAIGTLSAPGERALREGDAIQRNQVVETTSAGAVLVRLGTARLALGPNATLVFERLVLEGERMPSDDSIGLFLAAGAARIVTGHVRGRGLIFTTPTARLTIENPRTDVAVDVSADGSTSVSVLAGSVAATSVLERVALGPDSVDIQAGFSGTVRADGDAVVITDSLAEFAAAGPPEIMLAAQADDQASSFLGRDRLGVGDPTLDRSSANVGSTGKAHGEGVGARGNGAGATAGGDSGSTGSAGDGSSAAAGGSDGAASGEGDGTGGSLGAAVGGALGSVSAGLGRSLGSVGAAVNHGLGSIGKGVGGLGSGKGNSDRGGGGGNGGRG